MPLHAPCPHCGTLETDEIASGYVEGFLAEADYYCRGCTRHRAEFSYGAWRDGSGELASPQELKKLDETRQRWLDLLGKDIFEAPMPTPAALDRPSLTPALP